MDAHLVLEADAPIRVARTAAMPSAFTKNFGTTNSEIPFDPAGASGRRASTSWMMFGVMS